MANKNSFMFAPRDLGNSQSTFDMWIPCHHDSVLSQFQSLKVTDEDLIVRLFRYFSVETIVSLLQA